MVDDISKDLVPTSLTEKPEGIEENFDPELALAYERVAELRRLKGVLQAHFEMFLNNRRAHGGLAFIHQQTRNLIELESAIVAGVRAIADIKNKRFSQRAKAAAMEFEMEGGSRLDALIEYTNRIVESLPKDIQARTISGEVVYENERDGKMLEMRLADMDGEGDLAGSGLMLVSDEHGGLFVIDRNQKVHDPKKAGFDFGSRDRASVSGGADGTIRAYWEGGEIPMVFSETLDKSELKPPAGGEVGGTGENPAGGKGGL